MADAAAASPPVRKVGENKKLEGDQYSTPSQAPRQRDAADLPSRRAVTSPPHASEGERSGLAPAGPRLVEPQQGTNSRAVSWLGRGDGGCHLEFLRAVRCPRASARVLCREAVERVVRGRRRSGNDRSRIDITKIAPCGPNVCFWPAARRRPAEPGPRDVGKFWWGSTSSIQPLWRRRLSRRCPRHAVARVAARGGRRPFLEARALHCVNTFLVHEHVVDGGRLAGRCRRGRSHVSRAPRHVGVRFGQPPWARPACSSRSATRHAMTKNVAESMYTHVV